MKNLIHKHRFLFTATFILCFFFASTKTFSQDMDTLTWEEMVYIVDTVYKSGMDTIYEIDDSTSETTTFRTGVSLDCISSGTAINIHLNKTLKAINKGQFGVNATGLFTTTTLYEDTTSEDQWNWISNLQPKVMRFPGGSSSKFMHPLPYRDIDGLPGLDPIKGYGYDIVEITRYLDAVDGVLEAPDDAARLNFRNFIKDYYNLDMSTFNSALTFNLTSTIKKDMWITEWNLKDEGTDDRGKVFTNGFMHGVLLQEWWMKNLKLNFTSGFRQNFFTYSTLQNLAGGSGIAMLTPADEDIELGILGKDYEPYNLDAGDPDKRNYYVRRTNWFIMKLISEINKNNLNYFPATVAISRHNPNLPPTFFITPAKDYVYMYFTNS